MLRLPSKQDEKSHIYTNIWGRNDIITPTAIAIPQLEGDLSATTTFVTLLWSFDEGVPLKKRTIIIG